MIGALHKLLGSGSTLGKIGEVATTLGGLAGANDLIQRFNPLKPKNETVSPSPPEGATSLADTVQEATGGASSTPSASGSAESKSASSTSLGDTISGVKNKAQEALKNPKKALEDLQKNFSGEDKKEAGSTGKLRNQEAQEAIADAAQHYNVPPNVMRNALEDATGGPIPPNASPEQVKQAITQFNKQKEANDIVAKHHKDYARQMWEDSSQNNLEGLDNQIKHTKSLGDVQKKQAELEKATQELGKKQQETRSDTAKQDLENHQAINEKNGKTLGSLGEGLQKQAGQIRKALDQFLQREQQRQEAEETKQAQQRKRDADQAAKGYQ